jgi:prepilin-type N-terminal cleavage/methylation domain-containing protein
MYVGGAIFMAASFGQRHRTDRRTGRGPSWRAFTLIEVMIVVVIVSVLFAVAAPNFVRSRERARARSCVRNLRNIDGAKEAWAIETRAPLGSASPTLATLSASGLSGYLKNLPVCPSGGTYTVGNVGVLPQCSIIGTGIFSHSL